MSINRQMFNQLNRYLVRIQDDMAAVQVLSISTWASWQKRFAVYILILFFLMFFAFILLMPKWQQLKLLDSEVASLVKGLSKIELVENVEILPNMPPCTIEGYEQADAYLERLADANHESQFIRMISDEGDERIENEFIASFGQLKELLSCLARDNIWHLKSWQLERAGDLVRVNMKINMWEK